MQELRIHRPGVTVAGSARRVAKGAVEMTPHEEWARRFGELQDAVLRHYGVEARSRYIDLARPAIRAHVLEAGTSDPALIRMAATARP